MHPDIESVLYDAAALDALTARLAAEIEADPPAGRLVAVCVLKGSVLFYADLVRKLRSPVELEFLRVASYGAGSTPRTPPRLLLDLARTDYGELDLLLVEDIADSGRTLAALTALFRARGARRVRTCVLFDKPSRRALPFAPDYRGAVIPDRFVVGYGLDYNESYRNLPYVGVLKPVCIQPDCLSEQPNCLSNPTK